MTAEPTAAPYLPIRPLILLRTIHLAARDSRVDGAITDNVHEFTVSLGHDNEVVTDVIANAVRFPWNTCPPATGRLAELIGTPLRRTNGSAAPQIDKGLQCTHLFDLAKLSIAHAARSGERHYRMRIEGDGEAIVASLDRDGNRLIDWRVVANHVVNPGPFEDHVVTGRAQWSNTVSGDADLVEAGISLRRAILVFRGHRRNENVQRAEQLPKMAGACFSFQPHRMAVAERPDGFRDVSAEERESGHRSHHSRGR